MLLNIHMEQFMANMIWSSLIWVLSELRNIILLCLHMLHYPIHTYLTIPSSQIRRISPVLLLQIALVLNFTFANIWKVSFMSYKICITFCYLSITSCYIYHKMIKTIIKIIPTLRYVYKYSFTFLDFSILNQL